MLPRDLAVLQHRFLEPHLRDRQPAKDNVSRIDLHENLVQMPLPVRVGSQILDAFPPNFLREHRSKSIPPEPDGFMANINAALMEKIFHIPQRQRETDVQHNR